MRVQQDLSYQTEPKDQKRCLDLYIPDKCTRANRFIAFVHGGAWISNDRADFAFLGEDLARRGFIVALMGYRLTNSKVTPLNAYPVPVQDVADGLESLAKHCSDVWLFLI